MRPDPRLSEIERLLGSDPAGALARAEELLTSVPDEPMALTFQGVAHRLLGNPHAAADVLARVCERWPDAPFPHLQLGLALREGHHDQRAVDAMRRALAIKPDFADAWLALADLSIAMGRGPDANHAFAGYVRHSMEQPLLRAAAAALRDNRTPEAESILRRRLERHPLDVAALAMLADVAARSGNPESASQLLTRCLELAPGYTAARHNLAVTLLRLERLDEALAQLERLLADEPAQVAARTLKAAVLQRLGHYAPAIELYESLTRDKPDEPGLWTSFGHALRALGRRERSIEAYRKAIALAPAYGEAYWSLANLKTVQLSDADVEAMQAQLRRPDLSDGDRIHFEFALGKALEDRSRFEASFRHYAAGNRLRRRTTPYDPNVLTDLVRRSRASLTARYFAERSGWGSTSRAPIFVVGLPRSGSTLVEQILSSHTAVEGTTELTALPELARSLLDRPGEGGSAYPDVLGTLDAQAAVALGEAYLERTRAHRKSAAPHFIDKMPNNFAHLGLIQIILPGARIIDVRRHPLACGFSLFKHLFADGQPFSYDLDDIARCYCDYVELLTHYDAVLPGRVHRVHYEALVSDTESEVRRLLDYCGLPFEASCLAFYDNARAVATPSSEQVRAPIFTEALHQWRNYEPWLEPLLRRLAPFTSCYPAVPALG